MVSPSASAVLMLITRSNFVGCSTGRSAGLAPNRVRPWQYCLVSDQHAALQLVRVLGPSASLAAPFLRTPSKPHQLRGARLRVGSSLSGALPCFSSPSGQTRTLPPLPES